MGRGQARPCIKNQGVYIDSLLTHTVVSGYIITGPRAERASDTDRNDIRKWGFLN